ALNGASPARSTARDFPGARARCARAEAKIRCMSTRSAAPRPLAECAVVVSPKDNVAVVKSALAPGERVALDAARELEIRGAVTPGHRFATRAIPAGTFVLQYGQPIGTSKGIAAG